MPETLLGVRYRYAEEDGTAIPVALPLLPVPPAEVLLGEAAALPGDLVAGLRDAALIADLDRILELTGLLEARAPAMAQELRRLAEGFAYPGILALLERGTAP